MATPLDARSWELQRSNEADAVLSGYQLVEGERSLYLRRQEGVRIGAQEICVLRHGRILSSGDRGHLLLEPSAGDLSMLRAVAWLAQHPLHYLATKVVLGRASAFSAAVALHDLLDLRREIEAEGRSVEDWFMVALRLLERRAGDDEFAHEGFLACIADLWPERERERPSTERIGRVASPELIATRAVAKRAFALLCERTEAGATP